MSSADVQGPPTHGARDIERNKGLAGVIIVGCRPGRSLAERMPMRSSKSKGTAHRSEWSMSRCIATTSGCGRCCPSAVAIPEDVNGAIVVLVDECCSRRTVAGPRRGAQLRAGRVRCNGGHGRPRPSRVADPPRLRRQEPSHSPRRSVNVYDDGRRHRGDAEVKHLLSIEDLGATASRAAELTDASVEVSERRIPKVPHCWARPSCPSSTRLDAHAPVVRDRGQAALGRHENFSVGPSSVNKVSPLRDTSRRSRRWASSDRGAPRIAACLADQRLGRLSVINAGDGGHEHPTQRCSQLHDPPACGSCGPAHRDRGRHQAQRSLAAICSRSWHSAPRSHSSRHRHCCARGSTDGR